MINLFNNRNRSNSGIGNTSSRNSRKNNIDNQFIATDAYSEARRKFLKEQAERREREAELKRTIGQSSTSPFSKLRKNISKIKNGISSEKGSHADNKRQELNRTDLNITSYPENKNNYTRFDSQYANQDEIDKSEYSISNKISGNSENNEFPVKFESDSYSDTDLFIGDVSENRPLKSAEISEEGTATYSGSFSQDNVDEFDYAENIKDQFVSERANNLRQQAIEQERNNSILRTRLNRETAERLASIHKKQSRIQAGTMILFVLSAILLTLIIIQTFAKNNRPSPNLVIVQEGRMSDYFDTYGLVARDEMLINSPASGSFEPIVSEGTRVSIDNLLGRVVSEDGKNEILSQIRSLNRQISLEIVSLLNDRNFPEAIRYYSDADAVIYPDIKLVQQAAMVHSVSDLMETGNSIRTAMANRNRQLDSLNFNDPVIRDLREEKENYENKLNSQSVEVVSRQSGFVSFRLSDKDELLSPQQLENISFDEIKNLMSEYRSTHRTVGDVLEDAPIVRIATGGTQYFLLQVDGARTKDFPMEKSLTLEVRAESAPIDAIRILKVSPNSRGVLLLCSTQSQLERLLGRNVIEGKILMNSDRGLLVPASSLMFEDKEARGTADIYIVRSGYVHRETVRVRLEDSDQALVEAIDSSQTLLSSGAIIVSNPNTVREGQTLE